MEAFLDGMEKAPQNEAELEVAAHKAANSVSAEVMSKAINQIPTRCKKVIEVEGARFEYLM